MNIRQLARIGAAVAATAVTVTVLAGCGGSSAKTTAASATNAPGQQNGQQSIQAYISCLNKNGVTIALPSRGAGGFGGGVRPSGRPTGVRPSRSPGAGGFGGGNFGGGGGFGGLFGDPSTPPSGVSQSAWTAALAACKSVQPSFGGGGFGGGGRGGTQFQAYRNCLTSHGVSASAAPGGGFNTSDPTIAAAVKACRPLLPAQGPNPAPSPTS